MKKIVFVSAIIGLISFAVVAQPRTTPGRPPATNSTQTPPTPSSGVGAEGRVAYLNTSQFRQGIGELKLRLDALNIELEPKRKEIQALETEFNNLKNKIQTQSSSISPQVSNKWVEDAAEKERILKRKAEDFNSLGQKRLSEISQPIYEKIRKFLEAYCRQHGIVLALDAGAAYQAKILIWAIPAADITGDFMKEYNKANPTTAAPK